MLSSEQELNITPKPTENKTKEALKATQAIKAKEAKGAKEAKEAKYINSIKRKKVKNWVKVKKNLEESRELDLSIKVNM